MPSDEHSLRFLADMGVSGGIVDFLCSRGHDAIHVRDEGMQRASDEEIFRLAAAQRRVVITWDLDFGEIARLASGGETSVIVFRLRDTRTLHARERLDRALTSCREALLEGAVVVVEESRCRVRYLPVGHEQGT